MRSIKHITPFPDLPGFLRVAVKEHGICDYRTRNGSIRILFLLRFFDKSIFFGRFVVGGLIAIFLVGKDRKNQPKRDHNNKDQRSYSKYQRRCENKNNAKRNTSNQGILLKSLSPIYCNIFARNEQKTYENCNQYNQEPNKNIDNKTQQSGEYFKNISARKNMPKFFAPTQELLTAYKERLAVTKKTGMSLTHTNNKE